MSRNIPKAKIEAGDLTPDEEAYLRQRCRLPANSPASPPQLTPTIEDKGGIVDDDGIEEDYLDGWNNDQRRSELVRRKLEVEGRKDELIARLRRSDTGQLVDDDYSTLND